MRVTFVCPPLNLSGGIRVIALHAEGLRARGHDVTVVAAAPARATVRQRLRTLVKERRVLRNERMPPSHFDGSRVPVRVVDGPVEANHLPDADVIIATWWETSEWIAALPSSKGVKCVFLQGYEAHRPEWTARVDATWRLPFHKITISSWLANMARDRFGDPDAQLVPNAVDHALFNAPPRGMQSVPTVGFVYSTFEFKGVPWVVEALERARREVPTLRGVSFGSEPVHENMPLRPWIEFEQSPSQGALRDHYARCDAWILGSRSEGFGLPILEAMACRTPVIATPTGAGPELAPAGGWLIDGFERVPEQIAAAVVELAALSDEDWRARSDAALARAREHDWERSTGLFEAALERARALGPRA